MDRRGVLAGLGGEARLEVALFALAAVLFVAGHVGDESEPIGYDPPPRDPAWLRVVTWNVGGAEGEHGAALRDEHLGHVAEVLGRLDPDLAFLQEVRDREQLDRLLGRLGEGWDATVSRRGARRVAVLARRGSLRRVAIPRAGRPAVGVVYDAPGRPRVVAIGLHADALSSRRRNEQIGIAADALEALRRRYDPGVALLAGDLNLDLDLGKRRDLFTDDEYRDVETYNYLSKHLTDVALGRGSTAEPDRRLDYIFAAPTSVAIHGAGPVRERRLGDMDHHPVLADLAPP